MYYNYGYLFASCLPYFGGDYGDGSYAESFCLRVGAFSSAYSNAFLGGRLMFL